MKKILLRDSVNTREVNAFFSQAQGSLVDSSNDVWAQPQQKKD